MWTIDETCTAESAGSGTLDLGAPATTTSNTGPRRLLRHGKNGRRTCSSGSVSPSTYKLFEGRGVWLKFAELSDRHELERRRAAAFRTWTRFRPVWFRAGVPLRVRRLFFQALVVSILKTGLEALRLRPPDYGYFDRLFWVSGAR